MTGAWNYDDPKRVLTNGTQELHVEQELNWEASPRVPAIIYAGITSDSWSLWGKKVN